MVVYEKILKFKTDSKTILYHSFRVFFIFNIDKKINCETDKYCKTSTNKKKKT